MDTILSGSRPPITASNSCGRDGDAVRSVFISDTHLGCSYARADQLLNFLSRMRPEFVYLVGDFIDGWQLRRRWRWSPEATRILRLLVKLSQQGSTIRYAIGNHDDFLRENWLLTELINVGGIEIAEDFIHLTSDDRRFLVIHGDRFDDYSSCSATFEWVASASYNALLAGNDLWHSWFGGRHGVVSARVKASMRSVSRHITKFRSLLTDHARIRGCHGVVCGHVHAPEHTRFQGVEYCNTGDWLENCSAMVEDLDGSLQLRFYEASRLPPPV